MTEGEKRSRAWGLWAIPAFFLLLFVPVVRGIDFGRHWDEGKQRMARDAALEDGELLPHWYNYPSFTFLLSLSALTPDIVRIALNDDRPFSRSQYSQTSAKLRAVNGDDSFKLRARTLFGLVTSLAVLWVGLAAHKLFGPFEAWVAAGLVATSWEVGYHARWIAPDTPLMQFGALTLLCAALAESCTGRRRTIWLYAAATAAGLAMSTKYPGGLLVVPVIVAAAGRRGVEAGDRRRRGLGLLFTFALAYALVTPGTFLEPVRFYQDVRYEIRHYGIGHFGFTIEPGLEHFLRIGRYLAGSLFSPWPLVAIPIFSAALFGAFSVVRSSPRKGLLLVLFPVLYALYFSTQAVLFVRNLLVLAPFIAILAAHGCAILRRTPYGRALVPLAISVTLAAGAGFQIYASETIRNSSMESSLRELSEFIAARPDERFFVAEEVQAEALQAGVEFGPNATLEAQSAPVDAHVVLNPEMMTAHWVSNRPGLTRATFGPLDVNFEWYTSWIPRRIVVLDAAKAEELIWSP